MDNDDLSAFRKFIEEALDLTGLDARQPPAGIADWSDYPAVLADQAALRREIRLAWNRLHREGAGQTEWGFRLTPLALETRFILEGMIFDSVTRRFPDSADEETLRAIIRYTMTLSWLILGALQDKYE